MYPDGQGWAQGVVTCARQGALFTLAAPGFAHTAATAYLLGDPLYQRQGAGARRQRPVTESLFHGDSLVRCNRRACGDGQVASVREKVQKAVDRGVVSHRHQD